MRPETPGDDRDGLAARLAAAAGVALMLALPLAARDVPHRAQAPAGDARAACSDPLPRCSAPASGSVRLAADPRLGSCAS